MDFYQLNLAVFASVNAYLLFRQYRKGNKGPDFTLVDPESIEHQEKEDDARSAYSFQVKFFVPYALAVAADWLQVLLLFPSPINVGTGIDQRQLIRVLKYTPFTSTRRTLPKGQLRLCMLPGSSQARPAPLLPED
jgi:hypothetical protein